MLPRNYRHGRIAPPPVNPGLLNVTQVNYDDTHELVLQVQFNALPPDHAMIYTMAEHIGELMGLARRTMERLGPNNYFMTCILDSNNQINMLGIPRDTGIVVNRTGPAQDRPKRIFQYDDINRSFVTSLQETMVNIATSDTDVDWEDMIFELRFDKKTTLPANGKMPKQARDVVGKKSGLAPYEDQKEMCGLKAIIYALTRMKTLRDNYVGDLTWLTEEFPNGNVEVRHLKGSTSKEKRFTRLAQKLGDLLGMVDPYTWNVSPARDDTPMAKFVDFQPKYQVVALNEVGTYNGKVCLMEDRRGLLFDAEKAKDTTILLSYTTHHLHLITGPMEYVGREPKNGGQHFCYCCLKYQRHKKHDCNAYEQCKRCYTILTSAKHRADHCRESEEETKCLKCDKLFYNETCLELHHCLAQHIKVCECGKKIYNSQPHICGSYKCKTCPDLVSAGHVCYMRREDPGDPETAEEAGRNYYAFDLESMLIPIEGSTATRHEVNLVVLRRCFSDEEFVFKDLTEFVGWMDCQKEECTLFAHNLKGYDGRMVFDHLFDNHIPPQESMWRGSKVMTMKYGKVSFRDTLLHVTTSLEQMPKMFGLDESQFKKGFFPYRFNTPENQDYIGPIPDIEYFEPFRMKEGKRKEFMTWYDEQAEVVYDFKRELLEYCQSDVRILAKSIEAYMSQQMSNHVLNPFDSITIASYAMKVYKTFYIPENAVARLTSNAHNDIALSMHGGRTDTRRLLREWSDAEIAEGCYGKYQDVQSLYPTVQFYDPLPVGAPRYKNWSQIRRVPTAKDLERFFGFICCDIEPEILLFHPILVDIDPDTGRLVADLKKKTKIVIASPELHLALEHGYVIRKVHWTYEFDSSTDLFKSYFRTFLKDKIEASGVPKWIQTDTQWEEFANYHRDNLAIDLERDKMIPNASRKTGAKLLCNSLWGKFAENTKRSVYERFVVGKDNDKILMLEHRWMRGEIDILYRKYSHDKHAVGLIYRYNTESNEKSAMARAKTNIAIASMITSHARCRLWKEMHKLGDRVLYHDTDSIIYEHLPNQYNIPEGRYLGEWEDETGGLPIIKFVSTGPKCYSYAIRKPDGTLKEETKIKGINLTSANSKLVNFDSMKKIITGEIDSIPTTQLLFKYDRAAGEIQTVDIVKQFIFTYSKGEVVREEGEDQWKVFPFGHEMWTTPKITYGDEILFDED